MTDRELIELAAKAAGMHVLTEGTEWPRENVGWFYCELVGDKKALYDRANLARPWMPLTDDGDALRLAVSLDIGLMPGEKNLDGSQDAPMVWTKAGGWMTFYVVIDDPMVAVRRSIVQAAASILSDIR